MKYLITLTCFAALLFSSCKKDSSSPTKDSTPSSEQKLGALVSVQTSSKGTYVFAITEYDLNGNSRYHKDTTIYNNTYTFQYHPYVGNTVHVEADWRSTSTNPEPTIHFFYNSVEYNNFTTTTPDINPPLSYYKTQNFLVK